jgi:hypothetical protein
LPRFGDSSENLMKWNRLLDEVVFHHKSRTVILADLIENFEPEKLEAVMDPSQEQYLLGRA